MNRLFLLVFLLLGSIGFSNAQSLQGQGTIDDPYRIYTLSDLNLIRTNLASNSQWEGKHFRLMNDIEQVVTSPLSSVSSSSISTAFKGHFHGGGHSIRLGINTSSTTRPYSGLFGIISGASIDSLTIKGTIRGSKYAAAIAGYAYGENHISYCTNEANIRADSAVGGIVAVSESATNGSDFLGINIENCINEGVDSIYASRAYIGGIIGYMNRNGEAAGKLYNCHNLGRVAASRDVSAMGSIAGFIYGAEVSECTNKGRLAFQSKLYLAKSKNIGGLIGSLSNSTMIDCDNTGTLYNNNASVEFIGCLVGFAEDATIERCHNSAKMEISVSYNVGIGGILDKGERVRVYMCSNSSVMGMSSNGGIVREAHYSRIERCANYGEISSKASIYIIRKESGGIIATGSSDTILNCINSGSINASIGGSAGIASVLSESHLAYNLNIGKILLKKDIVYPIYYSVNNVDSKGVTGEHNYYIQALAIPTDTLPKVIGIEELSVENIIGNSLKNIDGGAAFKDDIYDFRDGEYPKLKVVKFDTVALLSTIPVYIKTGESLIGPKFNFRLNVLGKDVEIIKSNDNIIVKNDTILLNNFGDVSITLKKGSHSHSFKIKVSGLPFAEGSGTIDDPYKISTKEDLLLMRKRILSNDGIGSSQDLSWTYGQHFRLTKDIEDIDFILNSTDGYPPKNTAFSGYFHGGGHSVTLSIDTAAGSFIGLFGYAYHATIDSLTIKGSVRAPNSNFVAGIVGRLVGGKLIHSHNEAIITGKERVAGIVGNIEGGEVAYCSNSAALYSTNLVCGGIVANGAKGGGIIHHCSNIGDIESPTGAGGIVGISSDTNITISYCFNAGRVKSGTDYAGGIVSLTLNKNVEYSINVGKVSASRYAGAIVGEEDQTKPTIDNYKESYYDCQMVTVPAKASSNPTEVFYSVQTNKLIGNSIMNNDKEDGFSTKHWIFKDGLYPQIKGLEYRENAILSAIPVYLDEKDTVNGIRNNFSVSDKENTVWSNLSNKVSFVEPTKLKLEGKGKDTLVAQKGEYKKYVEIDIAHVYCQKLGDTLVSDCDTVFYFSNREGKILNFAINSIYIDTLTTADNCDSILTVTLNILKKDTVRNSISACNELIYEGNVYTKDTIIIRTLGPNAAGCDSILELTLNILEKDTVRNSISACNELIYEGNVYTKDTIIIRTLGPNATGCDSINIVSIKINKNDTTQTFITDCDTVVFENVVYTSDTILNRAFANIYGCDSINKVNIRINTSTYEEINIDSCDYAVFGGVRYTKDTIFEIVEQQEGSCKKIKKVSINIRHSSDPTYLEIEADNYVEYGGNTYISDTNITEYYTNAELCDSIVHIDINVHFKDTTKVYDSAIIVLAYKTELHCLRYEYMTEFENAEFKWYKEGVPLNSKTYIQTFKTCIPSGLYRAEVYFTDGTMLYTEKDLKGNCGNIIYPNPIKKGGSAIWSLEFQPEEGFVLNLLNSIGQRVSCRYRIVNHGIEIWGLDQAGKYVLRYEDKQGNKLTGRLIVI